MKKEYYSGNRKQVLQEMKNASLAVFFSGDEIRRSADENYEFFGNRNFLYLTGIEETGLVACAGKRRRRQGMGKAVSSETGRLCRTVDRQKDQRSEAAEKAGAEVCGYADNFEKEFHRLAVSGNYEFLYADTYKESTDDRDTTAHRFVRSAKENYPYLQVENATLILRKLRTIKQTLRD